MQAIVTTTELPEILRCVRYIDFNGVPWWSREKTRLTLRQEFSETELVIRLSEGIIVRETWLVPFALGNVAKVYAENDLIVFEFREKVEGRVKIGGSTQKTLFAEVCVAARSPEQAREVSEMLRSRTGQARALASAGLTI